MKFNMDDSPLLKAAKDRVIAEGVAAAEARIDATLTKARTDGKWDRGPNETDVQYAERCAHLDALFPPPETRRIPDDL